MFVTFAGPPFGALLYMLPLIFGIVGVTLQALETPPLELVTSFATVFYLIAVFAYLVGGLASLLTGLVLGWATWRWGYFGYGFALAVGVMSVIPSALLFAAHSPKSLAEDVGGILPVMLWPAMLASVLLRAAIRSFGWIAPAAKIATVDAQPSTSPASPA